MFDVVVGAAFVITGCQREEMFSTDTETDLLSVSISLSSSEDELVDSSLSERLEKVEDGLRQAGPLRPSNIT